MTLTEKLKNLKSELDKMENSGISRVNIICSNDCDCCKNYKGRVIAIKELDKLPMENCPLENCTGRFGAIVEFDTNGKEKIENYEYVIQKHWFHWVMPAIISIIFCWTIIIPVLMLLYTFLRMKLDKIYIKDGCLYSRLGIILIDKKAIPLQQISFITVKADIISEWLKMGCIQIQSSAFASEIRYLYIKNPDKMVEFVNNYKKVL